MDKVGIHIYLNFSWLSQFFRTINTLFSSINVCPMSPKGTDKELPHLISLRRYYRSNSPQPSICKAVECSLSPLVWNNHSYRYPLPDQSLPPWYYHQSLAFVLRINVKCNQQSPIIAHMQFLAARSRWTNFCSVRYFIPSAIWWHIRSSNCLTVSTCCKLTKLSNVLHTEGTN